VVELTKAQKRELRELVGIGHERELAAELGRQNTDFAAWKTGEIDPFELNNRIHRFHNGAAREVYDRFAMRGMEEILVARLIVDGVISESEVSPALREALKAQIESIRANLSEP